MGEVPVEPPLAAVAEVMTTVGRTESTVKVFVFELALTAEPLVWAVANTVCEPWLRAVGWFRDQLPAPVAVVVPMALPSTYTVTVLAAGAMPA